jgi:hypothetical protein
MLKYLDLISSLSSIPGAMGINKKQASLPSGAIDLSVIEGKLP